MNFIFDRLIAECSGGVTVEQAAKEAYRIMQGTGLPVFVRHNERLYKISLEAILQEPKEAA